MDSLLDFSDIPPGMLLVDYNQLVISSVVGSFNNDPMKMMTGDLIRHIVLNKIREARTQFKGEYTSTFICCDDRHYWRDRIFPYYKARRKNRKKNDKSPIDWDMLFANMASLRVELSTTFPYHVLQVPHCEADDIIATMIKKLQRPAIILSSDHDFGQLQAFPGVKQWSSSADQLIAITDPVACLKELTIRGDDGDDVPNVLSDDDTFVHPDKRQSPMTKARLAKYMALDPDKFDDKAKYGWDRNRKLVDLINGIPDDISQQIMDAYNESLNKPTKKSSKFGNMDLLDYFVKHKLNRLRPHLQDFV